MNTANFYYIGIILTCLVICYHYLPSDFTQESFGTKIKQIYCVGDSMLNNARYVGVGESVLDYLQLFGKKNSCNYVMLAKDGARLSDAFQQVDGFEITPSISNGDCIVISIGGNDLLAGATNILSENILSENILSEDAETLFQRFLDLVKSIHVKFDSTNNKTQLFVLNLYYPAAKPRFHGRIRQWNAWLDEHASSAGYTVIHTDSVITADSDLCYKIEPSAQGGEKIAGLIVGATC